MRVVCFPYQFQFPGLGIGEGVSEGLSEGVNGRLTAVQVRVYADS